MESVFEAPALHRSVTSAMTSPGMDEEERRNAALAAYLAWVEQNIAPPDEAGLTANSMEDLIATDRSIVRVEQIARHLDISVRAVQRLAHRYVGLPPLVIIRRYRLQEAAQRLREDPSLPITRVAADLGYSDHAHLSADFRRVLGFTPRSYRSDPGSLP